MFIYLFKSFYLSLFLFNKLIVHGTLARLIVIGQPQHSAVKYILIVVYHIYDTRHVSPAYICFVHCFAFWYEPTKQGLGICLVSKQ